MKRKLDRRKFIYGSSLGFASFALGQGIWAKSAGKYSHPDIIDAEIYQSGPNIDACWLYAGFVPRMQDPKRMKIVISISGLTVRASMKMTKEEVAAYAQYMVRRAEAIKGIEQGLQKMDWAFRTGELKTVSTPFKVIDQCFYKNFFSEIAGKFLPLAGAGYEANLSLLKEKFGKRVFQNSDGTVDLHMVFATTPPAGGQGSQSEKVKKFAGISIFEERRSWYSRGEGSEQSDAMNVFAGFPTFWFNGQVGMHGPIRYADSADNAKLLDGRNSDTGLGVDTCREKVDKRWQLSRQFESHGCYRLEHTLAIRAMLPAQYSTSEKQFLAQSVPIELIKDFDRLEIPELGKKCIVGVDYYWLSHRSGNDKKAWVETYYKDVNLDDVYEFPYENPYAIQIEPKSQVNSFIMASSLNRAPFANLDLGEET